MKLNTAKGVRDIPPDEKLKRNEVVDTLKETFELFGFVPLETPIIERFDVLSSKYAGGDEILKETFQFKDQGKRNLGLRYDLTVPLCRFVGTNPNLKLPFKRYEIGPVFRDGPIKLGRYRQFVQCDVDIVGSESQLAEAELISIASLAFKKMDLDVVIKVNHRLLLNGILQTCKIPKSKQEDAILAIDKLEKFGEKTVREELTRKKIKKAQQDSLLELLTNPRRVLEFKQVVKNAEGKQGIKELEELFEYLESMSAPVQFDPSLARGLSYYTGTVFEAFLKKGEIKSAIAGGGRYDHMIGSFLGGKKNYPAVGISFGLDVLQDAIGASESATTTQAFIIPINTLKESTAASTELRKAGINTEMDIQNRSISKNLKYANSKKIPYVIFLGEDEVKKDKLKIKDMQSGEEMLLSIKEVIDKILD